jgi:hypothetical protein
MQSTEFEFPTSLLRIHLLSNNQVAFLIYNVSLVVTILVHPLIHIGVFKHWLSVWFTFEVACPLGDKLFIKAVCSVAVFSNIFSNMLTTCIGLRLCAQCRLTHLHTTKFEIHY